MQQPIKLNCKELREMIPLEDNIQGKIERINLFSLMDKNNKGNLFLNQIQIGFRDLMNVQDIFDFRQIIINSFEAVRLSRTEKSKLNKNEQYLVFSEFRKFLYYFNQYLKYFEMFDLLDKNSDKAIDFEEFKKGLPLIKKWGIIIFNTKTVFNELDKDKSGLILFQEFCRWAIENNLDINGKNRESEDEDSQ